MKAPPLTRLRMRAMVYSSKDFESLWFLYQAEGLPKNISIEEFCTKHGVDYPTFDKWYRKTHKKVYPVTVKGIPSVEEAEIQTEAEKVNDLLSQISVGKPPDVFRQMEVKN